MSFRLLRGFVALLLLISAVSAETIHADLCIYSGNVGGIMAAIQAHREGLTVSLIEPTKHLGGMTSGGLSNADQGNAKTIGGLASEFYKKLAAYYHLDWASQIEPHVAEAVLNEMVRQPGVRIDLGTSLTKVNKQANHITSIVTDNGNEYAAKIFIDCSYEGDLMAAAGVANTLTREANSQYGETHNGVQFEPSMMPVVDWGKPAANGRRKSDNRGVWDRDIPVDPYKIPGDPKSGFVIGIFPNVPGPVGSEAPGLQAYCYRLAMTDDPANQIPITKPDSYDPAMFELVARFAQACVKAGDDMDLRWFVQYYTLPNHKYDFNTANYGSDLEGTGVAWCNEDAGDRVGLAKIHKMYQQGLFWFLLTDERIPQKVKDDLKRFGYCKDEFTDNDGWPFQLYVREGRRMISDFVMTEHHLQAEAVAPSSIGLGSYGIDSHTVRRLVKDGIPVREGKMAARIAHPYPIGYGAIVPKRNECDNLLVTFAVSASHVAYASIRMEPVLMNTSQSAASAAKIAMENRVAVQDVPYDTLRKQLLINGQILDWPLSTTH